MTKIDSMCLNHILEYVSPEIKTDFASLAPQIANISSEISPFPACHSSHPILILTTIVSEHLLHSLPYVSLGRKEQAIEQTYKILSLSQ